VVEKHIRKLDRMEAASRFLHAMECLACPRDSETGSRKLADLGEHNVLNVTPIPNLGK
jgi:hypothetical protein